MPLKTYGAMESDMTDTRSVLLTGGAGYVGSHTCVELLQAGWQVTILDNFSNARRDVIERIGQAAGTNPPALVEGDVRDRELLARVFAETPFHAVMHFAALKSVANSVADPLGYWDVNVGGTLRLLEALTAAGCNRFVFSSSATVYAPSDEPFDESSPLGPVNPYGDTKVASERLISSVAATRPGFAASLLRYFNPAGAHPSALLGEEPADPPDNLLPYIAQVAAGKREKLGVFGDDYATADGTGERDYVHVCDIARGHLLALEALDRDGVGHVLNLGTGRGSSVLQLRDAYARAAGRDVPYEILPRRAGDVARILCKADKAAEFMGFETQFGIDDICRSSWAWTCRKGG